MRILRDILGAFQFLTSIPMPSSRSAPELSRSAVWFPLVGFAIGAAAVFIHRILSPHLDRWVCAFLVVIFLTLITGGLHEDGLADVADAFGGGWNREQILLILRDSRIGSYGAIALIFSLTSRWLLIAVLPAHRFTGTMISAQILCRWTVLPLGRFLKSARGDQGQGARIAKQLSLGTLAVGSLFVFGVTVFFLRWDSWKPIVAAIAIVILSSAYYKHRIGGVTGDCFGATTQLTEIAVYLCGAWNV
jgi:adenosylcobinamide-GDP ribazoletransferase